MSLINQMLRDLELRQNRQANRDRPLPPGLADHGRGRGGRSIPWLGLVLVVGFVALGALATLGLKVYWASPETSAAPPAAASAPAEADTPAAPVPVAEPVEVEPARLQLVAEASSEALVLRVGGSADGAVPEYRLDGRRGEIYTPGLAVPEARLSLDDERVAAWQLAPDGGGSRLRFTVATGVKVQATEGDGALELRFTRPAPAAAVASEPPAEAEPNVPVASASSPAAPEPGRVSKRPPQLTPTQRADASYRDALQALNAGDVATARRALETALSAKPSHREARKALGSLLIGTGQAADGEAVLAEGIARQPGDTELRMMLARSQVSRGDVTAAIAGLEAGLPQANGAPDYRAFLGALYQRVSQHDAAIQEYYAALGANPSVPAWWAGLGISLEATGRQAEAAESYRRALRLPGLTAGLEQYIRQRLGVIG